MTGGSGTTEVLARTTQRWNRLRWALLVLWIAAVVGASSTYARQASIEDLYAAVSAGQVDSVTVTGGLPEGATGYAVQEVRWRDGWTPRMTRLFVVSPGEGSSDGDAERTTDDVAAELARRDGDLRITRASGPEGLHLDWPVPGWLSVLAFVLWAMSLGLLINGPQPWRATRWAWFWLLTPPLGPVLFLALSGPTPGLPAPKRVTRRLTGGWAFLIGLVIGGGQSSWYVF